MSAESLDFEYFRAMTPSVEGWPMVGPHKRKLGALPIETSAATGEFGPGTGGMSVSPGSYWNIPNHRRPSAMGKGSTGPRGDHMFAISVPPLLAQSLMVRRDPEYPERHAFVESKMLRTHKDYSEALALTRASWRRAWP